MKRIVARITFFLVFCGVLAAEPVEPVASLTLEEALDAALKNNVDLQKSQLAAYQSLREKNNGWNMFLPSVSASLGIANTHPMQPAGDPTNSWSAGASVSLQLSAAIPANIKLLDYKAVAAEAAYDNTRRTLVTQVSTSFYSLLAENMNLEILQNDMELKKQQYEQTNKNYQNGLASELEMLNAMYAYQIAGPTLNDAAVKYEQNRAAFLLLIGLDASGGGTGAMELEGLIEVKLLDLPPVGELTARYRENRYDVRSQALTLEQAKLGAQIGSVNRAPSISFSESISLSPPQNAGFTFDDPSSSGRFSLSVSIPISSWIPGSSQSLNAKTLKENAAQTESSLDTVRKNAAQDIQKKVDEIGRIRENLESATLNLRITSRAYELSEQGYRGGLVSQTDLQNANKNMVNAKQTLLNTNTSYLAAVYNLAAALGLDIAEVYTLYAQGNI
ncbi:outer membrane efflux protein [Treponema primitia ZAS-2]|uniref:Outer membrane efflux protein n=1 Tax=Treponema primitia (strain ATCC BAA-887 / DSM 12427 / ZAS-2) TaxID=545694 RepID=F5YR08_TREPZ|nr:TolC family protein [Treponema primitia]AEF84029.1 outer membrane efflux protein [Treponema primitia ZAS-2]